MEPIREGNFWEKLFDGAKVHIVELTPPKTSDISKYMDCARDLKHAGIDMLTIPDSPSANAHIDSSIMAAKLKRELAIPVLPHITCRDRNGIAMRALLMGLQTEKVENVLLVTGDPIHDDEQINSNESKNYKSVFEYSSKDMTKKINDLVGTELTRPFNIFGALNVNANNFEAELERAKQKIQNGMCGLLTQPVYTDQALSNLERASKELECFLFGGIMPLTTANNARFLNENVSGIKIGEDLIEKFENKNRTEASLISIQESVSIAEKMESFVDGFYIMTPSFRTDLICDILSKV